MKDTLIGKCVHAGCAGPIQIGESISVGGVTQRWYCHCEGCGVRGPTQESTILALQAWNALIRQGGKYGPDKGNPRKMRDVPASYFCFLWAKGMKREDKPVANYIRANLGALKAESPDGMWD